MNVSICFHPVQFFLDDWMPLRDVSHMMGYNVITELNWFKERNMKWRFSPFHISPGPDPRSPDNISGGAINKVRKHRFSGF